MRIGLVGHPGSGKSSVFAALTGLRPGAGPGTRRERENVGRVRVPDPRVDALARLFEPKKTTYAEVVFSDLAGRAKQGIDRTALQAMRGVDALCQVVRDFPDSHDRPGDPVREIAELETETLLADLEIVESRSARLRKDRSDPAELALLERLQAALEEETALRRLELSEAERRRLAGYSFLSLKPLLVVVNSAEDALAAAPRQDVQDAARQRGLGVVTLSAPVECEIAELPEEEQGDFLASLGVEAPARDRFVQAAYALLDLISMLTAGADECRAWPIARGTPAPRAAGRIHSDLERGFIRAEVIHWQDLVELGSEARCRAAGKLRVEGKDYVIQDGDVVHFRFNV